VQLRSSRLRHGGRPHRAGDGPARIVARAASPGQRPSARCSRC